MARKVFLSFLGNTLYQPAFYIAKDQDENEIEPTRFIQEAIIKKFCSDFDSGDKIYILTTKGALINWEDNYHTNYKTNEKVFYEGLETCLGKLNLSVEMQNEPIPDGESTDEIWEIFQIIFNLIEENDELIFDITHAFRSLPMLNMVLINYAKLLKKVSVTGIYYGNYEAKYESNGKWFSPIWNLIDFEKLQEWTNKANIFIETGNAIPLSKLISGSHNELIKKGLQNFSEFILVNRGMDIFKASEIIKLKDELNQRQYLGINNNPALIPILKKIEKEFESYKENDPLNGFLAVRWAIKNGLIQQGATLLEEAITTFVLCDIGEQRFLTESYIRTKVSAALTVGKDAEFKYTMIPAEKENETQHEIAFRLAAPGYLNWENNFIPIIQNLSYKKKLGECVNQIKNSIRNDINHSGFREQPRTYDQLSTSLSKRYKELKNLFSKFNKLELPEL